MAKLDPEESGVLAPSIFHPQLQLSSFPSLDEAVAPGKVLKGQLYFLQDNLGSNNVSVKVAVLHVFFAI